MNVHASKSDAPGEWVTAAFRLGLENALVVQRVEWLSAASRVRFSFGDDTAIDDCLDPIFVAELYTLLDGLGAVGGEYAIPGHVIRLPNLVLADVHVTVVQDPVAGEILVRFNRLLGNVLDIFAAGSMMRSRLGNDAASMAAEILEHAFLPLQNLSEHVRMLQQSGALPSGDETSEALASIITQIESMRFFQTLLQRSVARAADRRRNLPEKSAFKVRSLPEPA